MKAHVQHITAAALLLAFGAAQAANVTVSSGSVYNGVTLAGSSQYSFSSGFLAALDTAKVATTADGAGSVTVDKDTDGYYNQASASAPMAFLTLDSASGAIVGFATSGGFTLSATGLIRDVIGINRDDLGYVTVADLSIDLINKTVYGTISGNGLSAKTEVLWTIGSIAGDPKLTGEGTYNTQLDNLMLTSAALNDFTQGLKLQALGTAAFGATTYFGTITAVINPVAVPEPSTYALMGLGLVGMSLMTRRHKKSAN